MTKETFSYLWDQCIVKSAQAVEKQIKEKYGNQYKFKLKLESSSCFDSVFDTYDSLKEQIRKKCFDTGEDNNNLIDGHKICSCIIGAILKTHLADFEKREDIPLDILCSNYSIAFTAGLNILYLFLLSDYKRSGDTQSFDELKKQSTFIFPKTNPGHDDYVTGRIKSLALNDMYGIDFDVLTYADMLFWIERYNKELICEKVNKENI